MFTVQTRRIRRLSLALCLAPFTLATLQAQPAEANTPAPAEASDAAKSAAVEAMEKWLTLIDRGEYERSWDEAAASFQKAVSAAQWAAMLKAVREPLGALESRKPVSAAWQTEVPSPQGILKGEFVIAQFETSFANMKYALETVTFERQDGAWKAAGYYIKPR
jgi:hypothetical protein